MNGQVLTKQYLIKSIRDYNWALLFNRSKAKQLREKAQKILENFSNDDLDLYSDDLSDYMDAYIKTFGVIRKRRASDEAMRSFHKLNRDSYSRYNLVKHHRLAGFLAFESKLFRNVASFFGRYDLTEREVRQLTSSRTRVSQSLAGSNNNVDREEVPDNTKVEIKNNQPQLPHTDCLRPTQDPDYQAELAAMQRDPNEDKNRKHHLRVKNRKNLKKVLFGIGITALTFFGYGKYVSMDNAEAREDSDRINKAIEMGKKQSEKPADTIRFDEPIFPSVISTNTISDNNIQASIAKATVKSKETPAPAKITVEVAKVSNAAVKEKQNKQNIKTPAPATTNQIKGASNDHQDSLAKAYKNYYDNTIALHLGEKGKTELYAKINKAIHQGKIKLPAGVTMEHLALVMTVSNQVQPFSKANKLLQEIISGDKKLSAVKQQQIWQIVYEAGERGEHIKGTGSYSKYDNSSKQVKQSHNQVLQQLNAAGRLYKINNYGGK